MPKNNGSGSWQNFSSLFIFYFLAGEEKVNPTLRCPSINQLKRGKPIGRSMTLSYKLCINIFLGPVKIDIKTTQTKNKTV